MVKSEKRHGFRWTGREELRRVGEMDSESVYNTRINLFSVNFKKCFDMSKVVAVKIIFYVICHWVSKHI